MGFEVKAPCPVRHLEKHSSSSCEGGELNSLSGHGLGLLELAECHCGSAITNTYLALQPRERERESAEIRTNMQEHSVFLMEGRFISLCVFLSL